MSQINRLIPTDDKIQSELDLTEKNTRNKSSYNYTENEIKLGKQAYYRSFLLVWVLLGYK